MALARHRIVKNYKRNKSLAQPILTRMKKREKILKRKPNIKETLSSKQVMETINPTNYFILNNGTTIKNIEELAMMLDNISEEDFKFHVTEEKNDFANWINDVFGENKLAESITSMKTKKESQIALLKHTLLKK